MNQNYYQTLGVTRNATPEEIKKSYRKLARKYHPDISKEADAVEKMQAINVAYDTLSHADKKAEYDQMLDHPQYFSGTGQQHTNTDYSQFYHQDFTQQNHNHFNDFDDLFGRFGAGFGGGRQHHPSKGEDQHAKIEVDLAVAYTGSTQQISLQIPVYNAQGLPEIQRKTLEVKIPKGMKEGQHIRLTGQGQAGLNGSENGDLYLEIQYRHTQRQHVEGNNVYYTIDITPWEAALGGQVEAETPAGRLKVTIPANSKNASQLRLKGKGIPHTQDAGDLYLILNIIAPAAQNDIQKQAYENLANAFNHINPRA